MNKKLRRCIQGCVAALCLISIHCEARGTRERTVVSLDGEWAIADSPSASAMPFKFHGRVQVPGLVNLARPAFPDVDGFYSREHLANRIRANLLPGDWLTNYWKGKINQERNYFWYKRGFRAPAAQAVALLKVSKAQFGTAVWLNGKPAGEYAGCFTAGFFDLGKAIRWGAENELVIRIGAHPAVLPDTFPTGSDFEKIKWTPGIYDDVSLIFCENPVIESVQVAPRIASSEVVIQTRLKNTGSNAVTTRLSHVVKTAKRSQQVGRGEPTVVSLEPGAESVLEQTVRIENAHLWTPEDPFLYRVETATDGDSVSTQFGMREFRFDGATKRAYLNGKVYFLRGSNITLHRFFEDPLCKDLPWREEWVRTLLGDLPKKMHWNYFRFCIGPVPDRWLDICDEVGLLIQNEFFVWTGGPGWYKGYSRQHDPDEMVRQYQDWMRDNWNHPSVAVWDANNETKDEIFGTKIIPAVRHLDLSNRPWENSYNAPAGDIDPVEYHPYLMQSGNAGKLTFSMTNLETMDGKPNKGSLPSDKHAPIINEYGWLWLNRDGTPTRLTENLYPQLMGAGWFDGFKEGQQRGGNERKFGTRWNSSSPGEGTGKGARERLDMYAYLLAGKTEFWRAHREYAGIIHFVYLTCSYPGVYTADHFQDVQRLRLDPAFADYMGEAFKPLGVYLNFFHPTLKSGATPQFTVFLVNDYDRPVAGRLHLTLETKAGKVLTESAMPFALGPMGDTKLALRLPVASTLQGECVLRARAVPEGIRESTSSRRWVKVEPSSEVSLSR